MRALRFKFAIPLVIISFVFASCSDDPEPKIQVRANNIVVENGDDFAGAINGDFTSKGGSGSRTFNWQNSMTTADYNADITATTEGVFNIVVTDADANIVLDETIDSNSPDDSIDGVTAAGTAGIWSVTITLTNFDGDGSYSLSEGN